MVENTARRAAAIFLTGAAGTFLNKIKWFGP
jgi:hypothetical protein